MPDYLKPKAQPTNFRDSLRKYLKVQMIMSAKNKNQAANQPELDYLAS
jgi:hypothetical protein